MPEAGDRLSETFKRYFRVREFENVGVLRFAADFDPDQPEALRLFTTGIESMTRAGVRGFVLDLAQFSQRPNLEESLGHTVRCMPPVLECGGVLNWLHGSRLAAEWKRLRIIGVPPDNFESEHEAVEALRTILKAAHLRIDLAHRIASSGVSIRHVANLAGLFEDDVRRIVEGLDEPSDNVVLQLASTLDSLRRPKDSRDEE
jgi:hypothetical protein